MLVAAGEREPRFPGVAAICALCPYDCGAYVNRSFRHVRPGRVRAVRAAEWAGRTVYS